MAKLPLITSRYKNIIGTPWKNTFQDLQLSGNTNESWGIACSTEYLGYITQSAGGIVSILKLEKTGRNPKLARLVAHKGPISDLSFSPFDNSLIATASDDGTTLLWNITTQEGGGDFNPTTKIEPHQTLTGHTKKVVVTSWNPAASGIIATGSTDPNIYVWDILEGKALFNQSMEGAVVGLAWNITGKYLACVTRDKKAFGLDPRSNTLSFKFTPHEGSKSMKVCWIDGQRGNENCFLTTGFTKAATREIKLWDLRKANDSTPLIKIDVEAGSGYLLPRWEESTGLLFIVPKTDTSIRPYIYEDGNFVRLLDYKGKTGQRMMGFLPSRGVDVTKNEVVRCYKGEDNGTTITPISFSFLRKDVSQFSQEDYPPCLSDMPALTAKQWKAGETAEPLRVQLTPTGAHKTEMQHKNIPVTSEKQVIRNEESQTTIADQKKDNNILENSKKLVKPFTSVAKKSFKDVDEPMQPLNNNIAKQPEESVRRLPTIEISRVTAHRSENEQQSLSKTKREDSLSLRDSQSLTASGIHLKSAKLPTGSSSTTDNRSHVKQFHRAQDSLLDDNDILKTRSVHFKALNFSERGKASSSGSSVPLAYRGNISSTTLDFSRLETHIDNAKNIMSALTSAVTEATSNVERAKEEQAKYIKELKELEIRRHPE